MPETRNADQPQRLADSCGAASLRVPAHASYLPLVGMLVQWFGRRAGLSDEKCQELDVAVDEACSNVVRHAFPEGTAGEIAVFFAPSDRGLRVTVADKGARFCPPHGIEIAWAKRQLDPASGGSGLLLIKRLTDGTEYQWDQRDGNRFTLVKHR
jgi:serine/threonine-protein kinase RsbW